MADTHHVTWPDGNSVLCYCHIGCDHTVYRSAIGESAVDREALWRVVEQHYGEHPEAFLRSLLSSGELLDADEVKGEAISHAFKTVRDKHAELRAAIEALCAKADPSLALVAQLRALLADDGAALREVKHAVWCEAYYTGVDDTMTSHDYDHFHTPPGRVSPYRDTAREAGDE